MPPVQKLHTEFKDKGFEVRLITFRETLELVRRVVRERGYTSPTLIDASGDITGRVYGVFGPPTVYIVDRRGWLVARGVGARDWSGPAARAFVQALVDAPAN